MDVEFFPSAAADESSDAPEPRARTGRLPRWAGPVALTALAGIAAGAVVLSGGGGSSAPAVPQPSPTVHLGQLHEKDPSLHHQIGPNSGYLY